MMSWNWKFYAPSIREMQKNPQIITTAYNQVTKRIRRICHQHLSQATSKQNDYHYIIVTEQART